MSGAQREQERDLWARAIATVGPPPPPTWSPAIRVAELPLADPAATDLAATDLPATDLAASGSHSQVVGAPKQPVAGSRRVAHNGDWLIASLVTLGLIAPIPAVINGVRASRARRGPGRQSLLRTPARNWSVWALGFSLITVVAYPVVIRSVVGGGGGHGDGNRAATTGGVAATAGAKATNVVFGTTVDLLAAVAPHSAAEVPLSIRVSDIAFPVTTAVADVNAIARVRVCAATMPLDPLLAVAALSMTDGNGQSYEAVNDSPLLAPFYRGDLAAHSCVVGAVGYELRPGTTPQRLTFVNNDTNYINWSST